MNDSKSQKNEVVKNLFERKSVRIFEDRPISPEDRLTILQAACQAPTAGNQQLYTILEITEPALKKRLSVTCDNQPFIADAPLVLLFCADCQKWYDAYPLCRLHPQTSLRRRSDACCRGQFPCRPERRHCRLEPRHRFLLYRRYHGTL